jgi:hypothetical protein
MNDEDSLVVHRSLFIMARASKPHRRPAVGLEEITPGRFLVHDPQVSGLIKGEGTLSGRLFELTTWRREGLLARLRGRGFKVLTLADLAAGLPAPPPPPPIGGPGWRPLSSAIEQISHFDLRNLRWRILEPETRGGAPGVTIYDGWVLRRRKGRGAASFYRAARERGGGVGLRPLDETVAILVGYAQALALDDRPLLAERQGDHILLPDVELPPPHRALLRRVAKEGEEGLLVDDRGWPLAQDVFGRLGVGLKIG